MECGAVSPPCATELPPVGGPLSSKGDAVELEPVISDYWTTVLIGVSTPCGAVSTRLNISSLPRFFEALAKWMAIGPEMGPYSPRMKVALYTSPSQAATDQSGCDFHTMGGGISPGDVRFRSRVVGVLDVWMDSDPGIGSDRARVTFTLWTSPNAAR